MGEMHREWEGVFTGDAPNEVHRMAVPGGWIYRVGCWGDTEANTRPVFVPAPPRLVALEQNGIAVLVAPASVRWVTGWGADGALSVICTGDDEATDIRVKGTPAEVARRLGLEVSS